MKKLFIALFILLHGAISDAQFLKTDSPGDFANTLTIATGIMMFPIAQNFYTGIDQIGFAYEHKLYKYLFLSASFSYWNNNSINNYVYHNLWCMNTRTMRSAQ
jgi:hypothetical protein